MNKKKASFRDYHLEKLQDPQESKRYLEVALEEFEKDQDTEAFLLALRDVAEARGGMGKLATEVDHNQINLYNTLSKTDAPKIDTVGYILRVLGFRLSVEVLE